MIPINWKSKGDTLEHLKALQALQALQDLNCLNHITTVGPGTLSVFRSAFECLPQPGVAGTVSFYFDKASVKLAAIKDCKFLFRCVASNAIISFADSQDNSLSLISAYSESLSCNTEKMYRANFTLHIKIDPPLRTHLYLHKENNIVLHIIPSVQKAHTLGDSKVVCEMKSISCPAPMPNSPYALQKH